MMSGARACHATMQIVFACWGSGSLRSCSDAWGSWEVLLGFRVGFFSTWENLLSKNFCEYALFRGPSFYDAQRPPGSQRRAAFHFFCLADLSMENECVVDKLRRSEPSCVLQTDQRPDLPRLTNRRTQRREPHRSIRQQFAWSPPNLRHRTGTMISSKIRINSVVCGGGSGIQTHGRAAVEGLAQ